MYRVIVKTQIVRNAKDGSLLVEIPAGRYRVGGNRASGDDSFEVTLGGYYIGLHAVTNAQYARFVQATGHRPPETADWGSPVWAAGGYPRAKAQHPVVCVSWADAVAYCEWAELQLPGELEWEVAANGGEGREYPWGDEWDARACRHAKNRGAETTSDVWRYEMQGRSGWGVIDLAGNVWEWCQDWYDGNAYARYRAGDLSAPETGTTRVLRGGSWYIYDPGLFRCANRILNGPGRRNDVSGFRVARTLPLAA